MLVLSARTGESARVHARTQEGWPARGTRTRPGGRVGRPPRNAASSPHRPPSAEVTPGRGGGARYAAFCGGGGPRDGRRLKGKSDGSQHWNNCVGGPARGPLPDGRRPLDRAPCPLSRAGGHRERVEDEGGAGPRQPGGDPPHAAAPGQVPPQSALRGTRLGAAGCGG
eukprot:gene10666-biopygen3809